MRSSVEAIEPLAETGVNLSLYRAIWRWHFLAGLLVVPFLLNLAVTGGLYLFKDEIDSIAFAARNRVQPGGEAMPASALVERAEAAVPGSTAVAYREPADATRSARVTVASDAGTTLVFVDPYSGTVLSTVGHDAEFNWVLKKLHSLEYFGTYTNRIIEAVGGLALVLVVTGFYLWWPRGRRGGVVTVRGTPDRRMFWRDLHAVTGAFAGILIFFLAISGLPWSGFWGAKLNEVVSSAGIGYPPQVWDAVPVSTLPTGAVLDKVGWTVEQAPVPLSSVPAGSALPRIGIDRAVAIADALGMAPGFEVALPEGPTGVYTAAIFPADRSLQRTIHIDQYSGKPIIDIPFKDYGTAAKAIEFGINVHMGQEWGLANQLLMLAVCLSIVAACVSAVVMWWKRRPAGRLGMPPMPARRHIYRVLWIVAIVFGVIFPLTGVAILAILAIDAAGMRASRVLTGAPA